MLILRKIYEMARNNCLNINRLTKYNFDFITIEEVIILEYLLTYFQKNNLDVVVLNRIETETGINRNKIHKAVDELTTKGFISSKKQKTKTTFEIYIDKIVENLPKIIRNESKLSYQYFLYIQNPGAFNKRKSKNNPSKKEVKNTKSKQKETIGEVKQMSLF